jgi:hypothetical protein
MFIEMPVQNTTLSEHIYNPISKSINLWCLTSLSTVFQLYKNHKKGPNIYLNTQIYDQSLYCLGTGISINMWHFKTSSMQVMKKI